MNNIALMYHDVIENRDWDSSGFPSPDAARYKLTRENFEAHLEALRTVSSERTIGTHCEEPKQQADSVWLTFDDGGISAATRIAPSLECFGWRGHFFITTGWIGHQSFLSADMIRALDERGHLIGAHSHTHPTRMSACTDDELMREWRMSTSILHDILGRKITVASVPGGYYSRAVARAAAACGIRTLFTSEPTIRIRSVDGCRVIGRFVLRQGAAPETARDLAAGRVAPRLSQAAVWGIKKVAKRIGARPYLWVRQSMLTRASTRTAKHH